jgi:hypothetical protein
MDEREEVAVGLTGSASDAHIDTTLPPVVPAPFSMPVIVDE